MDQVKRTGMCVGSTFNFSTELFYPCIYGVWRAIVSFQNMQSWHFTCDSVKFAIYNVKTFDYNTLVIDTLVNVQKMVSMMT